MCAHYQLKSMHIYYLQKKSPQRRSNDYKSSLKLRRERCPTLIGPGKPPSMQHKIRCISSYMKINCPRRRLAFSSSYSSSLLYFFLSFFLKSVNLLHPQTPKTHTHVLTTLILGDHQARKILVVRPFLCLIPAPI